MSTRSNIIIAAITGVIGVLVTFEQTQTLAESVALWALYSGVALLLFFTMDSISDSAETLSGEDEYGYTAEEVGQELEGEIPDEAREQLVEQLSEIEELADGGFEHVVIDKPSEDTAGSDRPASTDEMTEEEKESLGAMITVEDMIEGDVTTEESLAPPEERNDYPETENQTDLYDYEDGGQYND